METSPLICSANQWTGFYMISASVMKGLRKDHLIGFLFGYELVTVLGLIAWLPMDSRSNFFFNANRKCDGNFERTLAGDIFRYITSEQIRHIIEHHLAITYSMNYAIFYMSYSTCKFMSSLLFHFWQLFSFQLNLIGKFKAQAAVVGNKSKGRISKRVFQENKACQIFRKTNISYPMICTRTCAYQGVRKVCFSENLPWFVFLEHPFWDSPFFCI